MNKSQNISEGFHQHYIYISGHGILYEILFEDNLKEFIEYEKNCHELTYEFTYKCRNPKQNFKCKENLCELVINYNQADIFRYLLKKNKPNIYCLNSLLNKMQKHNKKYDDLKKLFMDLIFKIKIEKKYLDSLFLKLVNLDEWDLIELLHVYGFKINNFNQTISKKPNLIDKLLDFKYKLNTQNLVTFICKTNFSFDKLNKYIKEDEFKNLMNNKIYYNEFYKMYGIKDLEFIKEFEKNIVGTNFSPNEKCLEVACKKVNWPVINYLLEERNLTLEDRYIDVILQNTQYNKRRKKPINYRRRIRQQPNLRKIIKYDQIFEKNMIELLKKYCNEDRKETFDKYLNRSIYNLIYNGCFNLVEYLIEDLNLEIYIPKVYLVNILTNIIKNDNVNYLKKIFKLKIINPIDVSTVPEYLSIAMINNASGMIKYLSQGLSMICSNNIIHYLKFRRNHQLRLIKYMEFIGFPINKAVIRSIIISGTKKVIKYIINKEYKIPKSAIILLLEVKQYEIVDYFIEKGYKFKKKNLMDWIIKNSCKKFRFHSIGNITIQDINYLIKISATGTKESVNLLTEKGIFNCVIHLYKKLGLKPDKQSIINYLNCDTNPYLRDRAYKLDFKTINYIEEEMGIKIFDELKDYERNKIFNNIIKGYDIKFIKYIGERLNIDPSITNLYSIIDDYYEIDLEKIKYFESYDIIPTKEIFLRLLHNNFINIANYLYKKYKYDITIRDVNNYISENWTNLHVLEYFNNEIGIKFTPYTVKIVVDRNLTYWNYHHIEYIINVVKDITEDVYNKINGSNVDKIINILKKVEYNIVEYEANDDEMVDPNLLERNLDEVVVLPKKIGGDYVDDVLNDCVSNIDVDDEN